MTQPEQLDLFDTLAFLERYRVTRTEPGKTYLHLYHGRRHPDENLDNWGAEGPVLGPVRSLHITYLQSLVVNFEDGGEFLCHGPEDPMHCVGDLVYCDGTYYGDFAVFVETQARSLEGTPCL